MLRVKSMAYLTGRFAQLGMISSQAPRLCFSTMLVEKREHVDELVPNDHAPSLVKPPKRPIGWHITMNEKTKYLIETLMDVGDSKEIIYGTLDLFVAWEPYFPIGALKHVLITLERRHQWHRVVQVIKWILSKGQGHTMGTYFQLIRALDMDHRGEEAHRFWVRKIGHDIQPVPGSLTNLMLSVYYRNEMFGNVVKLFKTLEVFGRKLQDKSVAIKVASTYELLGMVDEKEKFEQKYSDLLNKTKEQIEKEENIRKSKQFMLRKTKIKSKRKEKGKGKNSTRKWISVIPMPTPELKPKRKRK